VPGSTLISSYLAGLRRHLPADLADEVAGGLAEAYEYHLARGYGETAAARAAVSETGDLARVVSEFTLWVPKTYATRRYSWMTPPTRSCRRTRKCLPPRCCSWRSAAPSARPWAISGRVARAGRTCVPVPWARASSGPRCRAVRSR